MRLRVRFRYNLETGVVERFQVDDTGSGSGAAHDATHDQVSAEVGAVVASQPDIEEVTSGVPAARSPARHDPAGLDGWTAVDDDVTEGPEAAAL